MIDIIDDFLTDEEFNFVINYCIDAPYFYGEADNSNTPVTGMVHNVWYAGMDEDVNLPEEVVPIGGMDTTPINTKRFYELFADKIQEKYPECKRECIVRLYVNCFSPNDNPYFHIDDSEDVDSKTFLFYPTPGYNINDGGETQFDIDGSLYGVSPIPNRLVGFPAHILHRATSYRDRYRFTVAIKYNFNSENGK
jgi:hypothetical protein